MNQSVSHVKTTKASRYLQQLCKHFGHKVSVEFDAHQGSITLPFGTCALLAKEDALTLTVSGVATEKLERVIGDHLERFAFREEIKIKWQPLKEAAQRIAISNSEAS